jgi:F-type H+-transporting ATPase subunit delta
MKSSKQITRAARRLFRLCLVDGRLDDGRTRDVAGRIARSGRREARPMLTSFLRLVRLELARRVALVESAAPLPFDVQETVSAGLVGTYGAGMKATFTVNPSLVGGMRIKVGSDVYDGSVRARLAALEARL